MKLPVVVLGGGPAASACALSLRQLDPSIPVVIARPAASAGWQPGESLSPAARQILDSLGCWQRFLSEGFLESYGVRAAWETPVPAGRDYLASAHGSGWHLVRRRFDHMLVECAAESGVEVMDGARFRDATRCADGHWNLRMQDTQMEAAFVVDATGRNAVFATAAGAQRQLQDSLTAAFRLFRVKRPLAVETLVEAREHGWWYAVPVPGDRVAAGWMTDPDLL
ncbi:MAG: tryptophan 7-halogenase, partial [Acidobacteria bacterium]|nr:tryptophan 7-halogenase [Acidobacteriota bacterium]